jgi:PAS domain-containing protein
MMQAAKLFLKENVMRAGLRLRQLYPKREGNQLGTSERLQLEAELRASEDRFRLVLEDSPSPISVFDQTGLMRYISPTIVAAFGFSPEEMLRHSPGTAATG